MNYRTSMMAVTAFVAGVVAAGPATRLLPPRLAPNAAFADTVSQSADALRALALFGKALKLVQALDARRGVDPVLERERLRGHSSASAA